MKTLLLALTVVTSAAACTFPSDLWCSSEHIAKECKVYEQCKASEWTVDTAAPPVSFELYYECQCQYCQQFIAQHLYPVYRKLGEQYFNVTLVPYGNTRETKAKNKWVFSCQHGVDECKGNLLETCTIHTLKGDMNRILPFIACIESKGNPFEAAKPCAEKHKVDLDPIMSCYNSSLGNELEHQMAVKTASLRPRHTYVPWVVVKVHTEALNKEAMNNLLELICRLYKGQKPAACKKSEEETSVCFRE